MLDNSEQLSRTKTKRKKLIVENAYQMFLTGGIATTSMHDIAEACDITRRTIYNYFESKTDLLYFLMMELTERVDPDFHLKYDESINALENFRNLLRLNFESYYKHMNDFLFITQVRIYLSYLDVDILKEDRSMSKHRVFISEFEDVMSRGYEDGTILRKEYDIYDISKMVYQTLYGFLSNITIGKKIPKEIYDRKCKTFEYMIIEFLKSK